MCFTFVPLTALACEVTHDSAPMHERDCNASLRTQSTTHIGDCRVLTSLAQTPAQNAIVRFPQAHDPYSDPTTVMSDPILLSKAASNSPSRSQACEEANERTKAPWSHSRTTSELVLEVRARL